MDQSVNTGYVSELLAVADMNVRCGPNGWSYLNPAPQTPHDAFVKSSEGWRTVQVKTAKLCRTKTGISMRLSRRGKEITSDIIALVDDAGLRVRYLPNKTNLPPELPSEPSTLCKGVIYLNNPEQP